MISAVAILMLCNGIRMSPRSEKNTINEIGCVMEFMTHLFRFFIFSLDFTDESEGILAYRITHGISRNFGRWPMARARYMLLLFFVTQISQMTQIFLCVDYFVPQISQMTQIFLCVDYFVPQISQMTQIFLWGDYFVPQISQMTQIFLCEDYFFPQILQIYTDFSLWDFFQARGYLHRPDRSPPRKSVCNRLIRKTSE